MSSGHIAKPCLDRPRLHEEAGHVARQQIAVGRVHQAAPDTFLDTSLRTQPRLELFPEVVVLAHRVVQPADVPRMPHGVTRIAQADDLVDAVPRRLSNVGEPRRQVRRRLPAKPVLRRDHDVRLVPGLAERLRQRARDHHVPALDQRRAGGDDGDPAHVPPSSLKIATSPRRNASWKRFGRNRRVASKSGNIARSGGPTRR